MLPDIKIPSEDKIVLGQFYKILSFEDNLLYSLSARNHAKVCYPPGEWVQAPDWLKRHGHHLTVFDDLDVMREWSGGISLSRERAWAVTCAIEWPLPPFAYLDELAKGSVIVGSGTGWPSHTRVFEWVRLDRDITHKFHSRFW